jgi:hypothetical protein
MTRAAIRPTPEVVLAVRVIIWPEVAKAPYCADYLLAGWRARSGCKPDEGGGVAGLQGVVRHDVGVGHHLAADCGHQTSLTSGTVLEKTRQSSSVANRALDFVAVLGKSRHRSSWVFCIMGPTPCWSSCCTQFHRI